jgi:hypothetical protein
MRRPRSRRDQKDPTLQLSPGRAARHGVEYVRHGTLSLYAALNTQTGEVVGKTRRGTLPTRPVPPPVTGLL